MVAIPLASCNSWTQIATDRSGGKNQNSTEKILNIDNQRKKLNFREATELLQHMIDSNILFNVSSSTQSESEPVYIEGLSYTLLTDGTYKATIEPQTSLTAIVIPSVYNGKPVTILGPSTGQLSPNVTSITIPNSLTNIHYLSLYTCTNLSTLTVDPNNPKYYSINNCIIENDSKTLIAGCSNSIIPNDGSVTRIGTHAFACKHLLTSITIPDSIKSIDRVAFTWCKNLESISIGAGVISIGDGAFSSCYSLTNITIPDNVTNIGERAFSSCHSLTSITIPNNVTSIGSHAFSESEKLASIIVDESNPIYSSLNGNLYNKNQTELLQYASGKTDSSFSVPKSVTRIGEYAFYYCKNLVAVSLTNSIIDIEQYAFAGCENLKEISFPNSLKNIASDSFRNCTSLTNIVIPDNVIFMGCHSFCGCSSLVSVTIGKGLTSIAQSAFHGCDNMKHITIPNSITHIEYNGLGGCNSLTDIYFSGTQSEWYAVNKSQAYIPSSVRVNFVSSPFAFGYLENGLSWEVSGNSLTISGTETYIPSFQAGKAPWSQYASNIEEIYLFAGYIETIGAYAFYGLNNVNYINISSDSLTHVKKYAFGKIKTNIDIWFFGKEEQWKKIKIDYGNDTLTGSDVMCSKTSSTIDREHISIPSEDDIGDAFLDEHLSFANDNQLNEAIKNNSFSNIVTVQKDVLAAYYIWDILGDIGEVVSLKIDDLTIYANYYEMYLSDMILALNNEEQASKFEWKIAKTYNDVYGALKKALQTSDEWDANLTPSMIQEIDNYLTGNSFKLGENTAKALEAIFNDLYKNNKATFTSVFEGLSTASTVLDGVFAALDIVNAYVDAYNAYVVAKAFYEVNDEFFDICTTAGKRMAASSSYATYGKWFCDAVNQAKKSQLGKLSVIFDSAYQLTKSGTVISYNLFIQEFAKVAVYPTVAKLLGLASAGQFSTAVFVYNVTYGILDAVTGLGKESVQYKIINYITPVEKYLLNVLDSKRNILANSKSENAAVSYDMAYRILRQTNVYLCEAAYKYASLKRNTNDMDAATSLKNFWNDTLCHNGDYDAKYNIFSARCPVDVYIYDSNGMLVTSVINEEIVEYDSRITVMIGNGHKSFSYPSNEEFSFVIKAREEGTMEYSFGTINDTTLATEYTSYNIPLEADQEFSVTIPVLENPNTNDVQLSTNGTKIEFDYNSTTACETHSFGEWIAEKESKSRMCEICGCVEYVGVCSHNFETIEVYSIVPTCNTKGHTIFVCSGCGFKMSDGTEVAPIEHTPDENSIVTAPTCTKEGYTTHICVTCGESYVSDRIPSLGHSGGTATCTEKAKCDICNTVYGELTEHIYGDWMIVHGATDTEVGIKEKKCSCGHSVTEEIPKISANLKQEDQTRSNKVIIIGVSIVSVSLLVAIFIFIKKRKH